MLLFFVWSSIEFANNFTYMPFANGKNMCGKRERKKKDAQTFMK